MKLNNIIILAILLIPLGLFAFLDNKNDADHSSIANGTKPKMVMVTSLMCSECKKMKGVVAKVEHKYSKDIVFEKVMAGKGGEYYIKKYNVKLVPTFLFFKKDGTLKNKVVGGMSQNQLERYLEELKNG